MSIYYEGKDVEKMTKKELQDIIKEIHSRLVELHQTMDAMTKLALKREVKK
ncbi:unnamed protein product [marine sediment metagenome]|uniref:Uncharacterized protein n=1 Tax=marine sediment metagenome TaxID=412755 RepID=X0VR70_9ZZZZ